MEVLRRKSIAEADIHNALETILARPQSDNLIEFIAEDALIGQLRQLRDDLDATTEPFEQGGEMVEVVTFTEQQWAIYTVAVMPIAGVDAVADICKEKGCDHLSARERRWAASFL